MDSAALYCLCVCALSFFDHVCAPPKSAARDTAFPLRSVFDDGASSARSIHLPAPLGGTVRAWRRPASTWRRIAAESRHDGPAACFTHLGMTWERPLPRGPSLVPVKRPPTGRTHDLTAAEGFSIALCPMMGAYRPPFTSSVRPDGFTVGP